MALLLETEQVTRVPILRVNVSAITMPRAAATVKDAILQGKRIRLIFCTTHTLVESQSDPRLMDAVNGSDVVAPDGMPLVWLCNARGGKGTRRVYGPDAMLAFCEYGLQLGWRHYFYGSRDETLEALKTRLAQRFPGLAIAGSYSPPFRPLSPEEDQEIVGRINAAEPDLIWVGLGMPKQELWMAEHRPRLDAPALLGVGAAFDFHSGIVRQAPLWMQRSGTEWLFRLAQEPRRLWKRYLIGNSRFLWLLGREILTRR
ncbi:MAG: WecB/TagA/CpsF family glycosyltransferase [Dehalococcoidia bacterium]|nr:WecB/TagA/CpsF family glycosyltransferase [Dehalococcoidia bacterium]